MTDKENPLNTDIGKGGQKPDIEKGNRAELNESYIPDYLFTPPTPQVPPPANSDKSSGSESSGDLGSDS